MKLERGAVQADCLNILANCAAIHLRERRQTSLRRARRPRTPLAAEGPGAAAAGWEAQWRPGSSRLCGWTGTGCCRMHGTSPSGGRRHDDQRRPVGPGVPGAGKKGVGAPHFLPRPGRSCRAGEGVRQDTQPLLRNGSASRAGARGALSQGRGPAEGPGGRTLSPPRSWNHVTQL